MSIPRSFDIDRLTRPEAAQYLGVSVNTLESWRATAATTFHLSVLGGECSIAERIWTVLSTGGQFVALGSRCVGPLAALARRTPIRELDRWV